jgi:MFS family permease
MQTRGGWGKLGALAPFFGANVLFGAGLFAHAFLYNFYLDALDFGEGAMGVAAASLTAGGLLALAPAGLALDRFGSRVVYLGAVALAACGLALGAWAQRPAMVFGAAVLAGLGTASWRVAMGPVLMERAGPELRSRAFSWNVALLLASGSLWTALAGSLSAWAGGGVSSLQGIRVALWLGAAGTALAGVAFLLLPGQERGVAAAHRTAEPGVVRKGLVLPRGTATLIAGVFVWMLGAALALPFFNLYFQRVHAMSVEDIGLVFAAAQAVTALAVFGGGELAQRWGPRRAFGVWAALLPLALLALVLGPAAWLAVSLYAVQGISSPATNPLLDEIVLEAAPPEQRGAASSWRNGATEASGLVGAGLGGVLLERAGFGPLMAVAAAVGTLGALVLMRAFSRRAR